MEALHKLDLCGKTDENWKDYHKEYINIWDRRMEFLPIREPFFSSNIATCLKYIPQFRVIGKPYLLLVEEARTTPHSSIEEGDRGEDEAKGRDEDENDGGDEDECEGQCEDEED
ncbi:hypothetical protein J1N35_044313 [Gossypium stocksii]|uniref:Uncharacterized protein n=1 Tax=Gossypium stocksii TaxID=47602 RepID=A0A9D3U908_9ROSI|nr:hypothetical protein J1N35_044313 [Gossypium stocksii]